MTQYHSMKCYPVALMYYEPEQDIYLIDFYDINKQERMSLSLQ